MADPRGGRALPASRSQVATLKRARHGCSTEPRTDYRGEHSMNASEMTFEQHFSVDELSALWGMSDDFVRRLFLREPGVVIFFHHRPGRRVYRTLRIPESVALRVLI